MPIALSKNLTDLYKVISGRFLMPVLIIFLYAPCAYKTDMSVDITIHESRLLRALHSRNRSPHSHSELSLYLLIRVRFSILANVMICQGYRPYPKGYAIYAHVRQGFW